MKNIVRSLVVFTVVFLALAGIAIAQQQPYLTVSLPASSNGVVPVMLADWSHNRMMVVYGNSIVSISVLDGTVGNTISLPNSTVATITGGALSAINACIDPSTGILATITETSFVTGATVIQTVDPTGQVRVFKPSLDQFNSGNACTFSGGLLYVGGGTQITYANGSSIGYSMAISLDPVTFAIATTWPKVGNAPVVSMATAPSGTVYLVGQIVNSCASSHNCLTELDTLNSDGTSATLSQWTSAATPMAIFIGPNGWIYAGFGVLDQNGKLVSSPNLLGIGGTSVGFPSSDPWYAYVIANTQSQGFLGGYDIVNSAAVQVTIAASQIYLSVAASRQSDGTDLVLGLRNGSLDLYKIVPPQMVHFVSNAGLFESSSAVPVSYYSSPQLAPGSIVTFYGQDLAPWGTYLGADTTKIVTQLAGVSVYVDYYIGSSFPPLQLLFVGYNQVNAVLPKNNLANGPHMLIITNGSKMIGAVPVTVVNQAIADFMWSPDPANPSGTQPIITNQQNQLIGDPALGLGYAQASGGDAITFWATGIGATTPNLADGIAITPYPPLYWAVTTPQVLVDGSSIPVIFAGLAPLLNPGLVQVNAIVPYGLAPGKHDIVFGGVSYPGSFWTK